MYDEIELQTDTATLAVACPSCGAPAGAHCPGTIGVHLARWATCANHEPQPAPPATNTPQAHQLLQPAPNPGPTAAELTLAALKTRWRLTAEHEDGTRCPRTGKGKHRQTGNRDPRCAGRAFYVASCRSCPWTCRKKQRKAVEAAAELHSRFCTDQRLLRTSAQALDDQRRRECAAFAVPCPACSAAAGDPCIDTRRARPVPYTFLDGSPRAHIKRRTLAA